MADAAPVIPQITVGGESLVSAKKANEIIVPLNAILQGRVAPIANIGSFKYAGGVFILDLSALDGRLKSVEAQLLVTGNSALGNRVTDLETRLNNVITIANVARSIENFAGYEDARLNSANITANGSCSGNNITINVSLNL